LGPKTLVAVVLGVLFLALKVLVGIIEDDEMYITVDNTKRAYDK
jgi:hypothetical protein